MFIEEDPHSVTQHIDLFQVPMFVAERERGQAFRLLTINRAHADISGLQPERIRNTPIESLLPAGQAETVAARYSACFETGGPLQYRETLTINSKTVDWNTALIPTVTPSGRERVVGNAVVVVEEADTDVSRRVFDDINFFSTQAQFQLAHVSSFLDHVAETDVHNLQATDLKVLAGLCRSVDRSLSDIRAEAEPRVAAARMPAPPVLVHDAPKDVRKQKKFANVQESLRELSTLLRRLH